jgi:hypothetical protein
VNAKSVLQSTRAAREDWLSRTLERELNQRERELLARALAVLGRVADA